jgi:hypothetical protein
MRQLHLAAVHLFAELAQAHVLLLYLALSRIFVECAEAITQAAVSAAVYAETIIATTKQKIAPAVLLTADSALLVLMRAQM